MVGRGLYRYRTPDRPRYTGKMTHPDTLWWDWPLYRWAPLRDGLSRYPSRLELSRRTRADQTHNMKPNTLGYALAHRSSVCEYTGGRQLSICDAMTRGHQADWDIQDGIYRYEICEILSSLYHSLR